MPRGAPHACPGRRTAVHLEQLVEREGLAAAIRADDYHRRHALQAGEQLEPGAARDERAVVGPLPRLELLLRRAC